LSEFAKKSVLSIHTLILATGNSTIEVLPAPLRKLSRRKELGHREKQALRIPRPVLQWFLLESEVTRQRSSSRSRLAT
jgi:hypothetical protein